jgi:hypothetical protein
MNRNAAGRASEAHWQALMRGSKFADRLPIGLEAVIKEVPAATVKAFYSRWYHPHHMAVIAVGDFEVCVSTGAFCQDCTFRGTSAVFFGPHLQQASPDQQAIVGVRSRVEFPVLMHSQRLQGHSGSACAHSPPMWDEMFVFSSCDEKATDAMTTECTNRVLQDLDAVEAALATEFGKEGVGLPPAQPLPVEPWQPHREALCCTFVDKESQQSRLTVTFKCEGQVFIAAKDMLRLLSVRIIPQCPAHSPACTQAHACISLSVSHGITSRSRPWLCRSVQNVVDRE